MISQNNNSLFAFLFLHKQGRLRPLHWVYSVENLLAVFITCLGYPPLPGLWIRIRMDRHSFSLLDPNPDP